MIEVEIKLPVKNRETVAEDLQKIGFVKAGMVQETDTYFDNSTAQIRKNGEALRIRRIIDLVTHRTGSVITYKGRKMDQISMSRKELETGVEDASVCIDILEALGFHMAVPEVIKIRQEYVLEQMHACIDAVQGLGDFLELELVIADQEGKEAALLKIENMLHKLGYAMNDTVRNSYLSMLQHTKDE